MAEVKHLLERRRHQLLWMIHVRTRLMKYLWRFAHFTEQAPDIPLYLSLWLPSILCRRVTHISVRPGATAELTRPCPTYVLPCRQTHAIAPKGGRHATRAGLCKRHRLKKKEKKVQHCCQGWVCACAWMPMCQAIGTSVETVTWL